MNWKNTWILVGLAVALFAFIFLFERRLNPTGMVQPSKPLFAKFKPTSATSLTLRRGKQFTLMLERTNDTWRFVKPTVYPAATFAVENFLQTLERMTPSTHITPRDILARKQTDADFGFDAPLITLVLERAGEQSQQLRFGARTPSGDQVYVDMIGRPGVFVLSAELLERMPLTAYDWRNTALFHLGDAKPERFEILQRNAGFEIRLDPTNKLWRLYRPSHRADQFQVQQMLDKILAARVAEFVSDDAPADGEAFGLQAPQYEVTVWNGATARKVQFGSSPASDPTRVYARIVSHDAIVLVPKTAVDVLATSYTDLRDRQLVSFAPEFVDVVEVRAEETFLLRKDAGGWKAGDVVADPRFVEEWLTLMSRLEVKDFVKDVVTDFASFGLAPGQRQYLFGTVVTNVLGPTNVPIVTVAFGTNGSGVFARRSDEDSVYAIAPVDYMHMPGAAWQFRDHRIWSFTTNQVARVLVRQGETTRELLRQPNNDWSPGPGWTGDVNPFAIEETVLRLGELSAVMWLGRGEGAREKFGFAPDGPQFTVELRGEKPQALTLEFGGRSPLMLPYALVTIEGQPTVFEFPWTLYADLQRYFHLPAPAGNPRPAARP